MNNTRICSALTGLTNLDMASAVRREQIRVLNTYPKGEVENTRICSALTGLTNLDMASAVRREQIRVLQKGVAA